MMKHTEPAPGSTEQVLSLLKKKHSGLSAASADTF